MQSFRGVTQQTQICDIIQEMEFVDFCVFMCFQVNSPFELLEENADVHVLLGAKNWHLGGKLITVIDYWLVTMINTDGAAF